MTIKMSTINDNYIVIKGVVRHDRKMAIHPELERMHVLANSVRRTYNSLRHTTDLIHESLGISAPKRTLLLDLQREGPQTVPALAASRYISRQIIQTQVNELKKGGYVEARSNPEHKRSLLIALTTKGEATVAAMIQAEDAYIRKLGWLPEADQLESAIELLDSIYERINQA